MQGIKHYLIDELQPCEQYDVMTFQHRARQIIDNSKKPMIICGGTGLYIKSVLYNYEFEAPKRDDTLEERFKDFSNEELFNYLLKIDPEFDTARIHMNNRKRVLRAIEIKESSNESIEHFNKKMNLIMNLILYILIYQIEIYYIKELMIELMKCLLMGFYMRYLAYIKRELRLMRLVIRSLFPSLIKK